MLFVLSMGVYKIRDMLLKNLSVVKKNTLVNISNSYTPPEDISSKNISLAFMMSDFYAENSFNEPYYGSLSLRQEEIYIRTNEDGTTYRDFITKTVPISKCELGKNFFYQNEAEIAKYNLHMFYCPDWTNLTLQGNWYSPEYKLLVLNFNRCKGPNCATDEEMKLWLKNKWI